MITKKFKNLKGKTLIEILFNIGFKKQKKGLRIIYFINRKGISKIGVCIAKKKIRDSVKRNILKRRIRTIYNKNIFFFKKKIIIFFFWCTKKIPSSRRLKTLMKKILSTVIY